MNVIKGNFGECRIQDCLLGMNELKDKSIELCLTDCEYGLKKDRNGIPFREKEDINWNFNNKWFNEVMRISKGLVLFCGLTYFYDWIKFHPPNYINRIWYKPNVDSMLTYEPILLYGKIKFIHSLPYVIKCNVKPTKYKLIHPFPKPIELWKLIIKYLKPNSILDIFIGSGTTCEACEENGIKYIGFEIEEKYSIDIEKRIKNGIHKHNQINLNSYFDNEK